MISAATQNTEASPVAAKGRAGGQVENDQTEYGAGIGRVATTRLVDRRQAGHMTSRRRLLRGLERASKLPPK